jgi:TRAP-type C4-dicarboxylate transport system permease small subunit
MSDGEGRGPLDGLLKLVHSVEDVALSLLLLLMIVLAPLQIALRNFFDLGLPWADPLIRVLVLWVGLLGAVSAARGNRHITIDVLNRLLPPRPQAMLSVVTSGFTVIVCCLLAYHGYRFVADEYEYGTHAFSDLPAWIFQTVIPFAFGAIAVRYSAYTLLDFAVALGLREPPESGNPGSNGKGAEEPA